MQKSWLLTCFFNFFIAAFMGLLLRLLYVFPVEIINYQFLLHGHSHVAMLGWVYLMIYSLIVYFFIPKTTQQKPVYNRLFWLTEIAVIGMMFRFPVEGYAFFSIAFSTLHIFCSYYFCRLVWKDAHTDSLPEKLLLKTALFFMILSTLGVWCLGLAHLRSGPVPEGVAGDHREKHVSHAGEGWGGAPARARGRGHGGADPGRPGP